MAIEDRWSLMAVVLWTGFTVLMSGADPYLVDVAEVIRATLSSLETGQNDGLFVDFKARPEGQFECITVQSVRHIMEKVCIVRFTRNYYSGTDRVSVRFVTVFFFRKVAFSEHMLVI